ncbi:MAG: WhiB family transcriptional regulator [Candidatus Nanopelagicales bacterium]
MTDITRLPGPNADLWDWQLVARCREVDPAVFFHPEGERGSARLARERAAKAICATCPVIAECASHALSVHEPYGVWGGLSEDDRETIYLGTTVPVAV